MNVVERLRTEAKLGNGSICRSLDDAADEIERLRYDLELRNQTACDRKEAIAKLEAEIERLRAALANAPNPYRITPLYEPYREWWDELRFLNHEQDATPLIDSETARRVWPKRADEQTVAQRPPICEECGVYRSDPPSKLCPGCQAYRDHQA